MKIRRKPKPDPDKKPLQFGSSKMTPNGPVILSAEDRIERLEHLLAEQAMVVDAQTGIIEQLREYLAEKSLQVTYIMRIMQRTVKRKVVIAGMPDTETKTLQQLYLEQRDEMIATLMKEASEHGESVSTDAEGSPAGGNQGAIDDAAAARPRFAGPTRH